MRKLTKVLFTIALVALFSAAAAAAGIISINVTGEGGTPGDAIDAAFAQGEYECTSYFGGVATGYQVISLMNYPGFWWAELNVNCNVP